MKYSWDPEQEGTQRSLLSWPRAVPLWSSERARRGLFPRAAFHGGAAFCGVTVRSGALGGPVF